MLAIAPFFPWFCSNKRKGRQTATGRHCFHGSKARSSPRRSWLENAQWFHRYAGSLVARACTDDSMIMRVEL